MPNRTQNIFSRRLRFHEGQADQPHSRYLQPSTDLLKSTGCFQIGTHVQSHILWIPRPCSQLWPFVGMTRAYSRSMQWLVSGGPSLIVGVKAFGQHWFLMAQRPHLDSLWKHSVPRSTFCWISINICREIFDSLIIDANPKPIAQCSSRSSPGISVISFAYAYSNKPGTYAWFLWPKTCICLGNKISGSSTQATSYPIITGLFCGLYASLPSL